MKTEILGVYLIITIVLSFFLCIGYSLEEKVSTVTVNASSNYAENSYINGVPFKFQDNVYWCGPASLAIVLNFYGNYVSQENIASSVINLDNLTKCENLAEYAQSLGFNAYYDAPIGIEELKENIFDNYPIIVLQRYSLSSENGHFRVVVGYNDGNIITDDPFNGENYVLSYDNFTELWKMENSENEFVIIYPTTPLLRDNIPPTISIISPRNGDNLDNNWVEVYWEGSDNWSGIERYEVRLDSNNWVNARNNTFYSFGYVSYENHVIQVKALDRAGNPSEQQVSFIVTPHKASANNSNSLLYSLIVFALVIAVFGIVFLAKKKKKFMHRPWQK